MKKKLLTAGIALTMTVVLALTGTFAWQSISQKAKNVTRATVNPGARLHDDFNGTNKDIYVENFTPQGGGTEIYARVRLSHYMEMGKAAGKDAAGTAVSVVDGKTRADKSKWTIYNNKDQAEDNAKLAKFWDWELGGKTVYMPTFNMNKDSLATDINGTWAATDPNNSASHYFDYKTYKVGDTKTSDEIYDADDDDVDEGENGIENTDFTKMTGVPHTAQETIDGTVMTMADWIRGGKVPGNYWVWDTDGWAYWANPVQPGTATGLLLSGINLKGGMSDNWYYGVNVEGQFATGDDLGWQSTNGNHTGFYGAGGTDGTDITPAAEDLLATIKALPKPRADKVTIKAPADNSYVAGTVKNMDFTAAVTLNDKTTDVDQTIQWSISGNTDTTGTTITANSNGSARLTISNQENSKAITVIAAHTDYTGVVYKDTVEVKSYGSAKAVEIAKITPGTTTTVTIDGIPWYVLAKDTVNDRALLLSQNILEKRPFYENGTANNNNWKDSTLRTYLNGTWLTKHSAVASAAVEVTLYSQHQIDSAALDETQDTVFLLSQADVFGTWYNINTNQAVTDTQMYTYNGAPLPLKDNVALRMTSNGSWGLRSPCTSFQAFAFVYKDGSLTSGVRGDYDQNGVRPAFWYDLTK